MNDRKCSVVKDQEHSDGECKSWIANKAHLVVATNGDSIWKKVPPSVVAGVVTPHSGIERCSCN